jgi:hypothetical protein
LTVDNNVYGSFLDAFQACQANYTYPSDCYTDLSKKDKSDKEEDKDKDENNVADADNNVIQAPLADFEAFVCQRPGNDNNLLDNLLDALGTREIDRTYDWDAYINRHVLFTDIWTDIKAANLISQTVTVDSCPQPLNLGQRKLYNTVVNQYITELALNGPFPCPLLLNVDGVAESGKTFTLLRSCARLQELASEAGAQNPVFWAALTGIAAFNFIGKTIYSLLRLSVKGKTSDLSPSLL